MSLYTDPTFIALTGLMVICGGFLWWMLWLDRRDRRKDAEDLRKAALDADKWESSEWRRVYDDWVERERKAPPTWRDKP